VVFTLRERNIEGLGFRKGRFRVQGQRRKGEGVGGGVRGAVLALVVRQ
jgi:hypothetical protein